MLTTDIMIVTTDIMIVTLISACPWQLSQQIKHR